MKDQYTCKCSDCASLRVVNPKVFDQGVHAGIFATVKLAIKLTTYFVLALGLGAFALAVLA